MNDLNSKSSDNNDQHNIPDFIRKWPVRVIVCLFVVAVGVSVALFLVRSAPKVNRRPPDQMAPLVKTIVLTPQKFQVILKAKGIVKPAREIILKSQVSGKVIDLNDQFNKGGFLHQGTIALTVDPGDYELSLEKKKATVADAEYAMRIESGYQDVARREWEILYGERGTSEAESDLALRKPHLDKVQAELSSALAELEQAQIDLDRTRISIPFNALVKDKFIDLGSLVSPQENIAELIGTDVYWVQASVPSDRLQWITIPTDSGSSGSPAKIIHGQGKQREGRVIRLLGDVSEEGRMARILVAVEDPLGLKHKKQVNPSLLIGEYVRVEIVGQELANVFRIPRTALHNNSEVWLFDSQGKLVIRPVEILWRDEETVVIQKGLNSGEELIISELANPASGMKVIKSAGNQSGPTGSTSGNNNKQ